MCVELNFLLSNYLIRIFLKLNFSLIDFFAISLVQPAGGIWDNSLSPEDNQVNPLEKKQDGLEIRYNTAIIRDCEETVSAPPNS